MAQSGFTPIKIYSSTTAAAVPTAGNLEQGELAINTNDGKLFYEDSSGVVQVIATKAGATGSVTSVGGTGTVNGITLTGTVTTSGNLTLGGTLSGVSLTTQVSGTLPVANGGTNATTAADARTSLDVPTRTGGNASGTWGIDITGNAGTVTNGVYNNGGTYNINISGNSATAAALQTARSINGVSFNGTANITVLASTPNFVTFNNSGLGNGSGSNFNGGSALTVSYNTIGAPSTTGANASGNWAINVTGSAATLTTARLLWGQSFNGSANIAGQLRPTGATSIDVPQFSSTSDSFTGLWFPSAGNMAFVTGMNRELSVQSTNVFIGTTVSAVGSSQIGTQFSGRGTQMALSNNTSASSIDLYRAVDGSMINFLRGFSAVGFIFSNASSTTYSTSSDYRLKKDVTPLPNALSRICGLNPVQWKWKATEGDGEGFIAHELAEAFPHAVVGAKDAVDAEGKPVYQGVDSSFLVAALVASVKELSAKVDQLQSELAALKG